MITESEYNDLFVWLKNYIDTNALVRCDRDHAMPGKVPGTTYTWMFRLRQALCDSDFTTNVTKMFLYRIKDTYPDLKFQLAALEDNQSAMLTGLTLGAHLIEGVKLNAFSIRSKRRDCGLLNWIEGTPSALPTVLVNDAANAHSGFRRCYDICKQQGIPVAPVSFAILNKVNKDDPIKLGVDAFLPQTMKTISLVCLDDFGLKLNR